MHIGSAMASGPHTRQGQGAWVPERQARLTKILKDGFDDKPRPTLVTMPGGRA